MSGIGRAFWATLCRFPLRSRNKTLQRLTGNPPDHKPPQVPDAIAASQGYAISIQKRKLIEQGFGWAKTIGRVRQVMVRGLKKVDQLFVLAMAAYNLTRMRSLGEIRLQTA